MSELALHPTTQQQLEQLLSRMPHGLLLAGSEGIGKTTIASWLALRLTKLPNGTTLESYPYFKLITPEKQSISIDSVRELQSFAKLKTVGVSPPRITVIEHAHTMTPEAQNALLKLLEEPPAQTYFLLTATSGHALLPTIRSRVQSVTVQPPNREALADYLARRGYVPAKIERAYLMSGGLPGLMIAMLEHDEEHPLVSAASKAREFLRASTFERLAMADSLAKQKDECARILFMLQQMAQAALMRSSEQSASNAQLVSWQRILRETYDAEAALSVNAQGKLVLTNLALNV